MSASDEQLSDPEFTVAQDGDYEPADEPTDDDERPIDDEPDDTFPDDERVVVLDEEPDANA
ncbi:MAG TPA: hypothetical protein VN133_09665 [Humibacter sp.]|jgi:hypothetical protein|nr:hypothetical protein [Humibacter sp.]